MSEAKTFAALAGERVRAARIDQGLTQDELGTKCEPLGFAATRSVIHAIEPGTRQLELPELLALLAVLNLSLNDLLAGAGAVALDSGISVSADTLLGQAR